MTEEDSKIEEIFSRQAVCSIMILGHYLFSEQYLRCLDSESECSEGGDLTQTRREYKYSARRLGTLVP